MKRLSGVLLALVLACCGGGLVYWIWEPGLIIRSEVFLVAAALLLALTRPVRRGFGAVSASWDRMSSQLRGFEGVLLLPVVAAHFLNGATVGHRQFNPQFHDEHMHLLQARQLAAGYLAMPQHPLADFFETFYVFVKPVYASMYFPGTALAYVPAMWLNLPWIAWPVCISSAAAVMVYVVASRLLGRILGFGAMLAFLGCVPMSYIPTTTMSHPLATLQGMVLLYAWLRWRDQPIAKWAVLFGFVGGWMAITRPLEAVVYGLPMAVAVLGRFRTDNSRKIFTHAALAIAASLPFLSLQLAANYQITGRLTRLPISYYVSREFPRLNTMGTSAMGADGKVNDEAFETSSTLHQKQVMAASFVRTQITSGLTGSVPARIAHRTRTILPTAFPIGILLVLLPISLMLIVRDARWRVLWCIAIGFIGGYSFYGAYLPHYSVQIAPVIAILVAGCVPALQAVIRGTASTIFTAAVTLAVYALTIHLLFTMPYSPSAPKQWQELYYNHVTLPKRVKARALLFVYFGPEDNPHAELVYNIETPWPDDAKIIRLHDLGAKRNLEAMEYYARLQPDRHVYRYVRSEQRLLDLGNVVDVRDKMRESERRVAATTTAPSTLPTK